MMSPGPYPLIQASAPYAGALGGSYVGSQLLTPVGTGLGALGGILVAELLARSQNRNFFERLMSSISEEDNYNRQLAILAGAILGGGIGNIGGNIGGGILGYDLGKRFGHQLREGI